MTDHIVKTEFAVTRTRVEDLLCSALEGGSTYWCFMFRPKSYPDDCRYGHEAVARGASFKVLADDDEDGWVRVNNSPELITETLQLMADKYPRHWQNFINENDDAETGDVFFQLLCFKEVVYG